MTAIPTVSRRESEICEIEQDLKNLQRRYHHLERSARWTTITFYTFIGVLVLLALAASASGVGVLSMMIGFVIIGMCAVAYAMREQRLIDAISWIGWDWSRVPTRSEAMAIEDMVAERVERLKHLKANDK